MFPGTLNLAFRILRRANSKSYIFCVIQKQDNIWAKTVLEIDTKSSIALPIIDIAPKDMGKDKGFGVELGPVCFIGV